LNGTRKKTFSSGVSLEYSPPMPQKGIPPKTGKRQAMIALLAI
jgi:hypothetical protein